MSGKKCIWTTSRYQVRDSKHRICTIANDQGDLKSSFEDVWLPPSTIAAVQRLIMLPLSSPDEFTYGVLRSNKIHGALLYGAPGTGKTHLARALAKESGAS